MVTNLTDYIKLYDDMFDEKFCQTAIKTFNESEITRIDREQRPTFNEFNISQRFMARDPAWMSIQKQIQTVFIDIVKVYMNALQCEPDFPENILLKNLELNNMIIMEKINLEIM